MNHPKVSLQAKMGYNNGRALAVKQEKWLWLPLTSA
jgi:hypothetical protein